jgi:1-acyl-sn-glycerol-3-phosphate acyltransferase
MIFWRVVRGIVLAVCRVVFRVRVVGRKRVPRSGPYIVAPSHRSILDVPFAAYITRRRIRFLAKRELFSTRVGSALFLRLGAIPVDRGTTDRGSLRTCDDVLAGGDPLAIFPEGTRRSGPVLGDLFHGVAYLALKRGVPIVPVGVGGSEEILSRGHVIPRPHRVVVVVGEPIVPDPAASTRRRSDVAALTETLRAGLQACLDEARRRAGTAEPVPLAGEVGEHA